jgi:predicted RNase H-like HicB family nuclease
LTRKFAIIIKREGDAYIASCPDLPDTVAHGTSKIDALEKIRAIIIKKLDDGSDSGTPPMPHPISPSPRGPIILVEESHDKPDAQH